MIALPSTEPVKLWINRTYADGECWKLVRDAFLEIAGLDLPTNYYDAAQRFTQVYGASDEQRSPFTAQPWDVVMLRTNPRAPILVLHAGLAIDAERFIQVWGSRAILCRFDDPRFGERIAGVLRLFR